MNADQFNMDPKTLEALQGSISKWEKIVAGSGQDLGTTNCPLCQMFHLRRPRADQCHGCPVYAHTGQQYCLGTPIELRDATNDGDREADLASEELDFLRSLLPSKTTH